MNCSEAITIKCEVNNCTCHGEFYVTVYDCDGCIVYSGNTSKIDQLNISLDRPGRYRIRIEAPLGVYPGAVNKWINLCDKSNVTVYAVFYSVNCNISTKTFILTDRYYEGLPIEEGELTLWRTT